MTAAIAVGCGALGATARFALASWAQRRSGAVEMPVGTAVVNSVGSLLLGLVIGIDVGGLWSAAITGGLAGLTTYSTWMVETVALAQEGAEGRARAAFNLIGMAAIGLGFAWAGLVLGRALA